MATDSWIIFAKESQTGEGDLRVKVLETVFDLLVLHGCNFVESVGFKVRLTYPLPSAQADEVQPEMLNAFLIDTLGQEEHEPRAGAVAVIGMCKLMLSGMIVNSEVRSSPRRACADNLDSPSIGAAVLFSGDSRQPRAATVPLVLLSRLLLLLLHQPTSHVLRTYFLSPGPLTNSRLYLLR